VVDVHRADSQTRQSFLGSALRSQRRQQHRRINSATERND
jgi:hypothetical protein